MKVSELITHLQSCPEDAIVVLSKDSEGNTFSPLDSEFSVGWYRPENSYLGDFYTDEDLFDEDTESYDLPNEVAQHAVVLWPVN